MGIAGVTARIEVIFPELAPKIYQALKASQPPHLSAVPQWAKKDVGTL